jgi:hypothetical protein
MRTWFSEFSTPQCHIVVGIVDESDFLYPALKPLFDEYGYGFVDMNTATIYIDGGIGLDRDESKWVEAHEAAHIISGSLDEKETDLLAHKLLLDKGYWRSAELLMENIERHEI